MQYLALVMVPVIAVWLLAADALAASEWQTLKDGSHRIEADRQEAPKEEKITEIALPEGHYDPGQGTIEGAFGIMFGAPIDSIHVTNSLGWNSPAALPNDLEYTGLLKPLTIQQVLVQPPIEPSLLADQKTTYKAFVDFEGRPLSIRTSAFSEAEAIIEIISRKYGAPDEVDGKRSTYIRGDHKLHIYSKHASSAQLVYEDLAAFKNYLAERNLSLKRKYRNRQQDRLSPREQEIIDLALKLEQFRQGPGEAFGLTFGSRVGFKAIPDEFVPFDAPKPLSALRHGNYQIMVSPDLMPIAVRYELMGKPETLNYTKEKVELAMELAFAGFLKQTPNHTVLSFKQHAYSLLIRNGSFKFTVHDRKENTARNNRVKEAKVAAAEAKKEQQRLAELERQRQEIARRQKQIAEEKAF